MKVAAFYDNIKEGAAAKNIPIKEALASLKEAGLDMIYIAGYLLKMEWDELMPMLDELGLSVEGVHHFCDFTGNMPKFPLPDIPYQEIIDMAAAAGAGNVLLVPGMTGEVVPDLEDVKNLIVEGMTKAVEYGKTKGIKVSMEDFDGLAAPFCTVAGLKEFMDRVPDLYCSFDTGNFVMYHEDEFEAVKLFADRLCTMHIKDRSDSPVYPGDKFKVCVDGAKIYPSPCGYGTMKIAEILDYVREQGYDGNVIAEMFDTSSEHMLEGIEKSVRWLAEKVSK